VAIDGAGRAISAGLAEAGMGNANNQHTSSEQCDHERTGNPDPHR
jgi:hypothetical protein